MYDVGTGGCKYMGSAIDVFSRYAMIVALKTKGEFKDHYTKTLLRGTRLKPDVHSRNGQQMEEEK
jgi:hypothetical protein